MLGRLHPKESTISGLKKKKKKVYPPGRQNQNENSKSVVLFENVLMMNLEEEFHERELAALDV